MIPVRIAIERTFRRESGGVMASLIRVFGDFDIAEDAVQEAFAAALETWPVSGIPDVPGAWIATTAKRKAIDRRRRDSTSRDKAPALTALTELQADEKNDESEVHELDDDRLRLIFTCCHPALAKEAHVALTLRMLGGLSTPEIAAAFLATPEAMAQRIVRAKRKIRDAKIPYQVPQAEHWPERMSSVLSVVYLIFNEGYYSSAGAAAVRSGLCNEAIRLGRLLVTVASHDAEVVGLLALMILHHARRDSRGVALEEQDRALWRQEEIREGQALTVQALTLGRGSPYAIQAAIAALHAEAPDFASTDWRQIAALYATLGRIAPSPVIDLNRAAAVSMADGPAAGLAIMDRLDAAMLRDYQPFHAARADMLQRSGRIEEARVAYQRALALAPNELAISMIEKRLRELASL